MRLYPSVFSKLRFKMATFPQPCAIKTASEMFQTWNNSVLFFGDNHQMWMALTYSDRKLQGYNQSLPMLLIFSLYLLGSGESPVASSCREKDLSSPWRVLPTSASARCTTRSDCEHWNSWIWGPTRQAPIVCLVKSPKLGSAAAMSTTFSDSSVSLIPAASESIVSESIVI